MSQNNRTRTQHYAEKALEKIEFIRGKDSAKEYKSRSDNFPVMVMQAGLAQAIGFMLAKGNTHGLFLDDLAYVLGQQNGKAFQQTVIHADLPEYRRLTRETLNAAGWFKRFGQAYLSEK